ncbi:MAG: tetratricopeptide repeat protein [Bacteroidales bacterium]|nr:tetratricopeptide repeat protein [Bacteroidales bacterium]MDT8374292.1 tetratricopeptide repeat protein [Bacteroidales bacterium]
MKNFTRLFVILLAAVLMSGCSSLEKMKKNANLVNYEITPQVLETHGGIVAAQVKATYPEKYFDKKTTLKITPVLTYEGGETVFDELLYAQGELVQENNKAVSWTGGNISWSGDVNYIPEMKVSEFLLRVEVSKKDKTLAFDPIKLADGVIATSTLAEDHAKPIVLKDKYQRIVPEQKMADILYMINRSNIRSSELKSEDIQALKDYIALVMQDERMAVKGVTASSYASPDGPLTLNERLAEQRGKAAEKYLQKEYGKVPELAQFFATKTTPEDWDGFKTLVQESSIADKELILRVLSMYQDPVVREQEIKNMSAAYEALADDILPQLRRSKFTVDVDLIGLSDEEILATINGDASVLSLEQLLYAATLTEDVSEMLKYYKLAAEKEPNCMRAWNNIGWAYLNMGKADEALEALEKAKAIKNDDVIKNNMGFVELLKGNYAAAAEYFNLMTAATPESRFGLGTVAIHEGRYDQAVNFLSDEPSMNLALAQLLKGDVNKAQTTMASVPPCKCGAPSYFKAVIAARNDDKDGVINGLREAIGYNSDWKNYAMTDLEFAKYFLDDTFIAVTK